MSRRQRRPALSAIVAGLVLAGTGLVATAVAHADPVPAPAPAPALPAARAAGDASTTALAVPAFPTAVGFGAMATGGRGGSIYHVTNLNDSGAGSFRDAVSQNGRLVVFDVGGYIRLNSTVLVRSNITIAGQTAPGDGIGIMGNEVSFNSATNVIVRNMRFRQGTLDPNDENNAINLLNGSNMIFDHVSIEFGQWNNIGAVGASDITMQYTINANPIGQQFGAHTEKGPYTWYNNLFANAHNRCPLAKGNTQYINNIIYNWQAAYTAGDSGGHFLHDAIGNYFITGPRTTNASNSFYQMNNQSVYGSGNFTDRDRDGVLDGAGITPGDGSVALAAPWSATTASIPATSAAAAYDNVLARAGALPRDDVDNLVLADVRSRGTAGNLWADQATTGLPNSGYGTLAGGTPPADADRDAMPDAWELRHGLNPNSAADATGDFDGTGYPNVEKYINSLLDGGYA